MSLNKNVLNQKYYVVIPYFVEELGDGNFDEAEKRNMDCGNADAGNWCLW